MATQKQADIVNDANANVSRRDFLKIGAAAGVGVAGAGGQPGLEAQAQAPPPKWNRVADVVVVGSGASGLPAAIRARDAGASAIIVEENDDIGGHAMISGGNIALGGGTSLQKRYGIEDSADQIYLEHTRPDHPMTRYNDREVVRSFADHNLGVFDFLVANGVKFADAAPRNSLPAEGTLTARRQSVVKWSDDLKETINGTGGSGLARALEKSARAKGVEILLQHKMTRIVRERHMSGRVLGVEVTNLKDNTTIHIGARQAVIACTGGSSNNLVIRTIYDPRLTEEYQVGCEPYSKQTGDAEQQGMAIGASLGAVLNERNESFLSLQKGALIGARYGYSYWNPASPVFHKAGASGLPVRDYQDVILVNMVGQRFYDETASWDLSKADGARAIFDYHAAALASAIVEVDGVKKRVGGPIWAVFDADAVIREKWNPTPPHVDEAHGYFFSADTLAELAGKLRRNEYQKYPMDPKTLQETVVKYNSYVDMGSDPEFHKPTPRYKIQKPPFYAAWSTPILHDCYAGLRVNGKFQVIDIFGNVIPGFYCAGESAAGMTLHGLGRCIAGGYIAGKNAAAEPKKNPSTA
jgi:succinate dehydrogenase/fumarate reductase flavoprotein subunit